MPRPPPANFALERKPDLKAVIQLMFNGPVEDLQGNLQQFGLALSQIGQDWVIQVM